MLTAEDTMQQLKTLREKLQQDVENEISSFISNERTSIISKEDIHRENIVFLQNMKTSLTDEFSKEVFDFMENLIKNKECVWGVNPSFFEQDKVLENLLHGPAEKIECPPVKMQRLFSILPLHVPEKYFSNTAYHLMYAIIPMLGLIFLGGTLWGINYFFPFMKF